MSTKIKPRTEIELAVCKSINTKKLYYGLFVKGNPIKYWEYDSLNEAGKDLINELIKSFDLGYDVRFQFPVSENGSENKTIVPRLIKMYNEPCSDKKNPKIEENFYKPE